MSQICLVTGGARSGKSSFAELLASYTNSPVVYIATAQIFDEEMVERVKKHRQQRPSDWIVLEEPVHLADALSSYAEFEGVILVDCVTIWLSNLLLPHLDSLTNVLSIQEIEQKLLSEVKRCLKVAKQVKPQVIFVTNEVGQGIVPENYLARVYRDLAGRCNQLIAKSADEVYLVVAGYPIEIKHPGQKILDSLSKE
ncbi:MAG: bifunctional adenosylcobinamide kinase/adenosylcobinamide-phosphate guanylyltransferase [Desulfitobacterium hafniense]|nr:bifunctional adenosylcobinamide kinase/adenosylcobinamide-phosphate guanylyltransferase [Desulfitobacterium hafniense]